MIKNNLPQDTICQLLTDDTIPIPPVMPAELSHTILAPTVSTNTDLPSVVPVESTLNVPLGKRTREGARLTNLPHEEDPISKRHKQSVVEHLPPEVMVSEDTVSFMEAEPPVVLKPWIALNTSLNTSFLSTLKRKIISIIMHQPGITETKITTDFNVFRPSILKDLLDNLEIGGLVYTKTICYEKPSLFSNTSTIIYSRTNDPFQPSLCTKGGGNSFLSPHTISEKCYFAVPGVLSMLANTLTSDGTDYIDQYSNL